MTDENKRSRWAGALYLIVVATGLFSLVYVPSHITVAHDGHATVANVVALEPMFRLGIAAFMIEQVAFLLLPLALFKLLRSVDQNVAVAMVALAAVSVPIALVSLLSKLDVLSLVGGTAHAQVIAPEQLEAKVMLLLDAYGNGLLVTSLFWGLWLLPFGYLVFRSGFLPRILGVLLMLGCLGYLVDVFGGLLVARYAGSTVAKLAPLPGAIGEIGTCLWLLLVGARRPDEAR